MLFGMFYPRKFDINSLQTCPPYLASDVATLPWKIFGKKGGRFLDHSVVFHI